MANIQSTYFVLPEKYPKVFEKIFSLQHVFCHSGYCPSWIAPMLKNIFKIKRLLQRSSLYGMKLKLH
jgi:hypothetical protein